MQRLNQLSFLLLLCLLMAACSQTTGDPGPQPGDYTLRGTLYAPAGGDVSGSVVLACYPVGDDCDEARSSVFEVGATGPSSSFALTDLEDVAYELFALKDVNGNGEVEAGDYFGEVTAQVTPPRSGLELRMQVLSDDPSDPNDPNDPTDPNDPGDPGEPADESRFFLFTGDEVRTTTGARVEIDAQGGVHILYPAYGVGDAFYAYCPANCSTLEEVSVVRLPTEGTVDNAMLALDSSGKPQVLLSTYLRVYYATCAGDCRQESAWQLSSILEHGGAYEVSGEAFTLDAQDRPRFLMHPYRSFLPSGQPAAYLVTCDAGCAQAVNWTSAQVASQLWQESSLRMSADGSYHVATTVTIDGVGDALAYLLCGANCTAGEDNWNGVGLYKAFSDPYVSEMYPAVSLELTSDAQPRMVGIGDDEAGGRNLIYFACDTDCTNNENWQLTPLIDGTAGDDLGPGLDLALDSDDHPRIVYTADYNILMAFCDQSCEQPTEDSWELTPVELSADIPADEVIPYHNCTVSAWFLRQPSLAIGLDGLPRVAYRAEDISGSYGPTDPDYPSCTTGADMTLTRFAQLGSY